MRMNLVALVSSSVATMIAGLSVPSVVQAQRESAISQDPNRFLVVDCLLPGTTRVVGGRTYLTKQRPVKAIASECAIRGGDYVTYDRANYQTALQVWLPQAETGDAEAQTHVGEIFEKGLGRPANHQEAARWYQMAAGQGNARAQMNLAYLYEQGLGVDRDPLQALNLYRQAMGIKDDSLAYESEVTALEEKVLALTAQLELQNSEIDQLKAEVDAGQSQIASQQEALARARSEADAMRSEVARLQSRPSADPAQVAALRQLEGDLRSRELRLLKQEEAVTGLEAAAAEQNARLAEQLDAAARNDRTLRKQLQESEAARDDLQQKYDDAWLKLSNTEQRAARLKADLAGARAQIASQREKTASQPVSTTPQDQAERRRMAVELDERERQLATQQAQIASLVKEKDGYLTELTRLRSEQLTRGAAQGQQSAELVAARQRLAGTEKKLAELAATAEIERARATVERQQLLQRSAADSTSAQKRNQELTATLANRDRTIEQLERDIAALRAKQQADAQIVGSELAQQQRTAATLRQEIAITKRDLLESQQQVASLKGELQTARRAIEANLVQTTRSPPPQDPSGLRYELVLAQDELTKKQNYIVWLESQNRIYQEKLGRLPAPPAKPATPAKSPASPSPVVVQGRDLPKALQTRSYYALIIGIDSYSDPRLPKLGTAERDARAVEQILREKYDFETKTLINAQADRNAILKALNDFGSLKPTDSLLIYYAGHGEIRRENMRAYWLPANAKQDEDGQWIPVDELTKKIDLIPAKHVLVVADSCYQGEMARQSKVKFKMVGDKTAQIKLLTSAGSLAARTVLTSGGDKPVLDTGTGAHSVFAEVFLRVLRKNDGVLMGQAVHDALFQDVTQAAKKLNLDQTPQYRKLADAGDMNGDFLFIPRS